MNNRRPIPRLEINLRKIASNAETMLAFCQSKGVELTGVTKGASGSLLVARAFLDSGIRSRFPSEAALTVADLRVGDEVAFSMGHSAVMTAMASPFVAKYYLPERSA